MTEEEIARIICEHCYCRLKALYPQYSIEQYREMNKEYFTKHAATYLEVRKCLEETS